MTKEQARAALYRRKDSSYLYYDFFIGGRRFRGSTKTSDEEVATGIVLSRMRQAEQDAPTRTMKSLISLFTDPKENPKYVEAQSDGSNYGYDHSCHVAKAAGELIDHLSAGRPDLLYRKLEDVTADDLNQVKLFLVDICGRRRKTQSMFSDLKTMFSYAAKRGWIRSNPAEHAPNIRYDVEERCAVDILLIRKALELEPNSVLPYEEIAYFLVLATTGLRRSEGLALSTSEIKDGILLLQKALKKTEFSPNDIGSPKWDIDRAFPLPNITKRILAPLKPVDGQYFPHTYSWGGEAVRHVVSALATRYPADSDELMKITCHVLRHSLNTALGLMGCPEQLLERWFGWSMRRKTMQMHYTHIYARNLKAVANTVDFIFSEEFTGFDSVLADNESSGTYFDLRPVGGVFTGNSPFRGIIMN